MKGISPCAEKAQGIVELLSDTAERVGGGELLSRMVRLSSEGSFNSCWKKIGSGFWEEAGITRERAKVAPPPL